MLPVKNTKRKRSSTFSSWWSFYVVSEWLWDFQPESCLFTLDDKRCKAEGKGGGCASTKPNDAKESEASFILVQKNNYACLSFCTSLYAALIAAFHILSQRERASVFEGNQCLWFIWVSLIFFLAFLQTISLFSLELFCHKRWRFWIAYIKYFSGSGI